MRIIGILECQSWILINGYCKRNTRFSRMNIIFFSVAGVYFFRTRLSLFSLTEGWYHIYTIYTYVHKITYFLAFFEKDLLSFSVERIRLYFREKEILFFLILQEKLYSRAIFLERPSYQNIWKKKIWFFVLCKFIILKNYDAWWVWVSTVTTVSLFDFLVVRY